MLPQISLVGSLNCLSLHVLPYELFIGPKVSRFAQLSMQLSFGGHLLLSRLFSVDSVSEGMRSRMAEDVSC